MQSPRSRLPYPVTELHHEVSHFRYPKDHASLVCATLGVVFNLMAYMTLEPLIVALMFFLAGLLFIRMTPLGGHAEWRMFRRIFSVCFMAAGLAAIYLEVWQDAVQLYSDPAGFFRLAKSGAVRNLPIEKSVLLTDGSLMLYIWTPVYDFFEKWGFSRGKFLGVSVNMTLVASSGVVAVKMLRRIYGNDPYRISRLIDLLSFCGIFWLFAGLHVRDAGILLLMTLLSYACITFVQKPGYGRRLLLLVLCFYATDELLFYLRSEFRFIPLVMLVAMVYALRSATESRRLRRVATVFSALGGVLIVFGLVALGQEFTKTLDDAHDAYESVAEGVTGANQSLGYELIVNQPLPVRIVLGTAYTYLAPIPVWLGFLFPSAMHLFKSINALFNYILLPMMGTAVLLIYRHKTLRTPPLMYIMASAIGLSAAVGLSSMEARHLGAFMIMPLLLATAPDLRVPKVRMLFRKLLRLMLYGMGMIHLLWFVIKTV
jgi:hypothetical protein